MLNILCRTLLASQIKLLTFKNVIAMFKVCFGGTEIFSAPNVEPALAFALELHRISNVPHVITVVDNLEKEVVSLMGEMK